MIEILSPEGKTSQKFIKQ
ncbi:hypothetical protein [Chryseobacterium sp. PMSZPI]